MPEKQREMETLLRIKLENGTRLDVYREENGNVRVCSPDHCLVMPKAPGHQVLDFFALLEPFGEIIEPEGEG